MERAMMNYQNIFLSSALYLSVIAALFYVLIFNVLPKSKFEQEVFLTKKQQCLKSNSYMSSANWKYLRETVLKIQGDRCLCCGKASKNMHIDHIKPKSIYPHLEFMVDNLQVLCPDCNRAKSYTRETDYRKSDHLIALVREINENKLLQKKYVYDYETLERLAKQRFNAELGTKKYPRILPLT
jgi:hypothetical protein